MFLVQSLTFAYVYVLSPWKIPIKTQLKCLLMYPYNQLMWHTLSLWGLSVLVTCRPLMTMTSTTLSYHILCIIVIKKQWIRSFPALGWSNLLIVLRTWKWEKVGEAFSFAFSALYIYGFVWLCQLWRNISCWAMWLLFLTCCYCIDKSIYFSMCIMCADIVRSRSFP